MNLPDLRFTPGPWRLDQIGEGLNDHVSSILAPALPDVEENTIGAVERHCFEDDETLSPEMADNAVLMILGPDMWELVADLKAYLRDSKDPPFYMLQTIGNRLDSFAVLAHQKRDGIYRSEPVAKRCPEA